MSDFQDPRELNVTQVTCLMLHSTQFVQLHLQLKQ
jgi:hypothetical protein